MVLTPSFGFDYDVLLGERSRLVPGTARGSGASALNTTSDANCAEISEADGVRNGVAEPIPDPG